MRIQRFLGWVKLPVFSDPIHTQSLSQCLSYYVSRNAIQIPHNTSEKTDKKIDEEKWYNQDNFGNAVCNMHRRHAVPELSTTDQVFQDQAIQ